MRKASVQYIDLCVCVRVPTCVHSCRVLVSRSIVAAFRGMSCAVRSFSGSRDVSCTPSPYTIEWKTAGWKSRATLQHRVSRIRISRRAAFFTRQSIQPKLKKCLSLFDHAQHISACAPKKWAACTQKKTLPPPPPKSLYAQSLGYSSCNNCEVRLAPHHMLYVTSIPILYSQAKLNPPISMQFTPKTTSSGSPHNV